MFVEHLQYSSIQSAWLDYFDVPPSGCIEYTVWTACDRLRVTRGDIYISLTPSKPAPLCFKMCRTVLVYPESLPGTVRPYSRRVYQETLGGFD